MEDIIVFENYGCQIIQRQKFYVRYDGGGMVVHIVEYEITPEEAEYMKRGREQTIEVIQAVAIRNLKK